MASKVIHSGYLTKVGAKVKNWKLRWMVLFGNGKLHYYKKPPQNVATEEPQGVVNVQTDVIELILWDEALSRDIVKWPSDAIPQTGFALKTRQGRVYCVHAESLEATDKWIDSIRSVGANIRLYPETIEALRRRDEARHGVVDSSTTATAPTTTTVEPTTASPTPVETSEEPKKYVHKVIGGMVIATESK